MSHLSRLATQESLALSPKICFSINIYADIRYNSIQYTGRIHAKSLAKEQAYLLVGN